MLQVLRKIQTLSLSLGVGGSYSVLTKPFYPRSLGNIFHRSTCPAQGVNKKSHSLHSWAGSKYWRALSITFPGNSSQHRLASPILRSSINKTSSLLPGAKSISVPAMFDNPESSDPRSNRLIWVDLEMTGLDFVEDRILEIACLITEGDLRIVAEGPHIIIHESDEVLNRMGEWCTQHHGESGLTEAVRKSKISLAEAEQMVLDFVRQHTPKGKCPLAGNTISMDRSFILKHMPLLAEHLHYRVLDVSTVKELCRRWYEKDLKVAPVKKNNHRAVDDILESIEELKFYRSAIFKCKIQYTGQTSCSLRTRFNNHKSSVRRKDTTPVAIYFNLLDHNGIADMVVQGVDIVPTTAELSRRESSWIWKLKSMFVCGGLNQDEPYLCGLTLNN